MSAQVLILLSSRLVNMKIRDMPIFYQFPKRFCRLEALELSEATNGQYVWVNRLLFPGELYVRFAKVFFIADRNSFAVGKVNKVKGGTTTGSALVA